MTFFRGLLVIMCFVFIQTTNAQSIPSNEIIPLNELSQYLKPEVQKLLTEQAKISTTTLASYFRDAFSTRYFYNWKTFDKRFEEYNTIYKGAKNSHKERALDHINKFADSTKWKLPFNYLNGEPVNAYALRHLARQHKMVDIAFYYNYQNKNSEYLNYFKTQLRSLNAALLAEDYETIEDGNGVYEAFRSGYRILNWLRIHNMFLGEKAYSDEDQLLTIATLLQHAASLYETNLDFVPGNHQTRGMSALAMLSILFRDFKDSDKWYDLAMKQLEAHLDKEINDDGFQFERTVHYHMSDIDNYYYVYQLAKNSQLIVNDFWESKLKSLFTTLTKIAYPDKSAPVLSDDTSPPWSEKNDISGALTLGYLLFEDPEMGYFANNYVEEKMFWYVSDSQLEMLANIESKKPNFKSFHFPTTGYYMMREGWNPEDKMMVISAGLDADKPDHQHGDMLGVQAMANGHVILPNYQVRYSLKDLELFKNSMVKNVALVDDELQGKQYTSNQGGSGFGKFKELPNPKTIAWKNNDDLDVFVGSHDGFENIGVNYNRQVIYVKDDFWIVKDNFKSDTPHAFKQVWQGHYSLENGSDLLRATFNDGTGLDIFQLNKTDQVKTDGARGKEWSVVSKTDINNFSFVTIIYPFSTYDKRIDEDAQDKVFCGWKLNDSKWKVDNVDANSLTKGDVSIFFSVKTLEFEDTKIEFEDEVDVLLNFENEDFKLQLLNKKEGKAVITKKGIKQTINCAPKTN